MHQSTNQRNWVLYAAGPIDLAGDDAVAVSWREQLLEQLNKVTDRVMVFDPSRPYMCVKDHPGGGMFATYVERINAAALGFADIVVALFTRNTASVGTPIELHLAHDYGKPIVLISDVPYGRSVYLDTRIPYDMRVPIRAGDVAGTMEDAAHVIASVLQGIEKAESRIIATGSQRQNTVVGWDDMGTPVVEEGRR